MRLVYLGTPEAAVPPLQALVAAGHTVELVVSQPDRKRGRGGALLPSPVKQAALHLGLSVTDQLDDVLSTTAELGVVVAFGKLIKPRHLQAMPYVNIHFSLLPRWRGAAPVERAILAGDSETGCCLMALEEGLDTGPVYSRETTPIDPLETAPQLRERLVVIGTSMLVESLSGGLSSLGQPVAQSGDAVHAEKLRPKEFQLHWEQPVAAAHGIVRLGQAWTTFRGKRLKVLAAHPAAPDPTSDPIPSGDLQPGSIHGPYVACGDGFLHLITVQPEGKSAMAVTDWLNGTKPSTDERLGASL